LSGELRAVAQLDRRLAEAARFGFKRCLIPRVADKENLPATDIELVPVGTLREAIRVGLIKKRADAEADPDI